MTTRMTAYGPPDPVIDRAPEPEQHQSAYIDGMWNAARICKADGADWAYDLIVNAIDAIEAAQ